MKWLATDSRANEVKMDSVQRDPRKMSDEGVTRWMRDLVNKLANEKGSAGGACSLEAIKNPVRREILEALEERALTIDEVSQKVGVAGPALRFHLSFLKGSYFIQIEGNIVDLTPGGVSVVRSRKRT
jgi:DNA-binding transcriptional ArsR family regulator